ncbi:AMP-binding protein [Nocardioides massiliensis]|uniref:Acetyl-CoA synthetase n=1 Tax=Nocardioides massiliensis TaxID=1325935 RepID=A0ABT9NTI8_9ACTN|nr:AMP-binding protein [Nocardioides massiliensis]MDP9823713.1 acetyl-CoA synthetase [Nocardioides massiliensis]
MTTTQSPAAEQGIATAAYREARDHLLRLRGRYEQAVEEFRYPDVGERFCWAVDWFDAIARGNDRPALVVVAEDGGSETVSFDEMARRSDRVAAWLSGLGVTRGQAVLVMLGNQVEMWEVVLGIMKLGAVVMPTATAVGPEELADRVRRGGAVAVVTGAADMSTVDQVPGDFLRIAVGAAAPADGWLDLADAAAVETGPAPHPGTSPDDPLLFYFTSGTTSRPKLVQHTQLSYPVGHLSTAYWIGLQPGDVHLNISSPGWAKHAWSSFFAPWIAEATIFVLSYSRFDAASLMRVLRTHEVTSLCAPPTVWRMLINGDLSGGPGALREVVGAGEPLNPEVIDQIERAWGLTIRDGFGQTETTASIGNVPGAKLRPGSMGRPLPGVPVVLLDPATDEPVTGPGEGEICLDRWSDPVSLMAGYRTEDGSLIDGRGAEGRWYRTGDVASIDEEGYITYIGRTDDVFKASDYKISPFELESVLIEHPAVAEAAVVPAPDPVRLAVPKAYIALAPGFEPGPEVARDVLAHARARLAPWQRVRRIEFAPLPKTISGKIRRVELRGREDGRAGDEQGRPELEWREDDFPDLRS